jgi:hypothetical protein
MADVSLEAGRKYTIASEIDRAREVVGWFPSRQTNRPIPWGETRAIAVVAPASGVASLRGTVSYWTGPVVKFEVTGEAAFRITYRGSFDAWVWMHPLGATWSRESAAPASK